MPDPTSPDQSDAKIIPIQFTPAHGELVKKLTKVLGAVQEIPKSGYNSHFRYHYATESDITDELRSKLAAEGVFILTHQLEASTREVSRAPKDATVGSPTAKVVTITKVKLEHRITDGNAELVIHSFGEAEDGSDKGIYKAVTGAMKYFLLKNFLISTGDDPEADGAVTEEVTGPFEDIVTKVDKEKTKGNADIYRVRTGKHGTLSTFEKPLADRIKVHAGTGEALHFEVKVTKFGPDVIGFSPAALAPSNNGEPKTDAKVGAPGGAVGAAASSPSSPPPSGAGATEASRMAQLRADMNKLFQPAVTVADFKKATSEFQKRHGKEIWNKLTGHRPAETFEAVRVEHWGRVQANEKAVETARANESAEKTIVTRIVACADAKAFTALEAEVTASARLRDDANVTEALMGKGKLLGVPGYGGDDDARFPEAS